MMPGRNGQNGGYRYGFNGKEMDNDMSGVKVGATYDYGFRIYDARIAKFLSVDPLTQKYPELTPYQFASNTPMAAIDLDGLESAWSCAGPESQWTMKGLGVINDKQLDLLNKRQKVADKVMLAGNASSVGIVTGAYFTIPEITMLAGTTWSELPFVTSLTTGWAEYVEGAINAGFTKHRGCSW
jgi:RHS repeat-associated protein